ncbi:MAG: hypothetical protein SFY70_01885 [Bacteroidia bacterium]|nr:hypothetical protein [Bacteroidia bacterium]
MKLYIFTLAILISISSQLKANQVPCSDTLYFENAKLIEITTKRLFIFSKSDDDIYLSTLLFELEDNGYLLLNYRGQNPIPTNKGSLLFLESILELNKSCWIASGGIYSFSLVQFCIEDIPINIYYNSTYSKMPIRESGNIDNKDNGKQLLLNQAHPYFDMANKVYKIILDGC